jgi:hypothetical protein
MCIKTSGHTFEKSKLAAQEAICHQNLTVNNLMNEYVREEGKEREVTEKSAEVRKKSACS